MANMNRILIIGASSGIGLQTCKTALQRGHAVVAFARRAHQIKLEHQHLTKFQGDALNEDDLNRAMQGVNVVIQTLGVAMNFKLITGPVTLFSNATEIMIKAMHAHDVSRLLAITGFGAGDSIASIHPLQKIAFNMVFGRAYADKDIQEKLIEASTLAWTIARPGVLTNCQSQRAYRVLKHQHEWKNGIISRLNVADFLVANIRKTDMIKAAPVLIT